jgi:phosphate transport system substrate-binding protein
MASLAVAAIAVGAPAGFTSLTSQAAAASGTLNGAGSTLVAPLEAEWAAGFHQKTGNTVNYQAVGSGTGIADITARSVDFGASDAPLTAAQAGACQGCVMIPWALTATGVGYNVPGAKNKLRLTGPVLAKIYLGQITNWSNPAIKSLNKGLKLPNLAITTVHRADGSGDTYAFTNYLSKVSGSFKSRVGVGTSVSFPGGVAETGNSAVVSEVQATKGAIGYAAVSYLINLKVPAAAVKNAAGKYEYPNYSNIENAASVVKHVPKNNAVSLVNPPKQAKIAYPISTFTYAIVPKSSNKQASLLKGFVKYAIGPGQAFGPKLDFAKLPKVILKADQKATNSLG